MTNDTNTLPSDDEPLETPLVSSTDDTPPYPNLLVFQELQFSVSSSTAPTIHSAVISGPPTSHSKENSIHNKHDLKDERIEQLNAELKAFKSFIRNIFDEKSNLRFTRPKNTKSLSSCRVFKGRNDISYE